MPPLYAFEIAIHARPDEVASGPMFTDPWGAWPTLDVPKAALATPLEIGFDDAIDRLGRIERMFAEPDGSFVWACSRDASGPASGWWQVDGNAFDRAGRVVLVDLKGSCPAAEFDRLLGAFGWPEQTLVMQLVRPAVFLDEATFRRHAEARGRGHGGQALRPS
jgi:hypothetical protein